MQTAIVILIVACAAIYAARRLFSGKPSCGCSGDCDKASCRQSRETCTELPDHRKLH